MKPGTYIAMVPKLVQHNRADLIEEYYNVVVNSPILAGCKQSFHFILTAM